MVDSTRLYSLTSDKTIPVLPPSVKAKNSMVVVGYTLHLLCLGEFGFLYLNDKAVFKITPVKNLPIFTGLKCLLAKYPTWCQKLFWSVQRRQGRPDHLCFVWRAEPGSVCVLTLACGSAGLI